MITPRVLAGNGNRARRVVRVVAPIYARVVGYHLLFLFVLVVATWNGGKHMYKNQRINSLEDQNEAKTQALKEITGLVFGKPVSVDTLSAVVVTVTSYNPTRAQGWGDGMITNDGNLAVPGVIALSHDLFDQYGLTHGQTVILKGYGAFRVADKMNKRFKRRVDIISLIPQWSKKFGVRESVLYYAKERGAR